MLFLLQHNVHFLENNHDYISSSSKFYYEDKPNVVNSFNLDRSFDIYSDSSSYYRAEIELNEQDGVKRFALTNPIWVTPGSEGNNS